MVLTVSDIFKRYADKDVLRGVSFTLEQEHKIALVGQNGSGKSTLLKIIAGLENADSGEVLFNGTNSFGYLPQEEPDSHQVLFDYIQASEKAPFESHIIFTMMDGLGVHQKELEKPFCEVSGGQRSKVLLARLLLEKPDVLLLDEPTNNLDIPSLVWLEAYLKNYSKGLIVVSHDPYFLKETTNRLLEIDFETGQAVQSRGSYLDYLERREKDFETAMKKYKEAIAERDRLFGSYKERQKNTQSVVSDEKEKERRDGDKMGRTARTQRAGMKMDKVSKQLKVRALNMDIPEKPIEAEVLDIAIHSLDGSEDGDIAFDNCVMGYKDSISLSPFSAVFSFGSRVCILGENGSGKSTFLHTLTGNNVPLSGTVAIGQKLVFGDLTQHHEMLFQYETVRDFYTAQTRVRGEHIYNTLKKYGIDSLYVDSSPSVLSPGARARVLFSTFEQNKVNVLVLDEPTNHLDMEIVSSLVRVLSSYTGTVVLTTHNRWFLEKISIDRFYNIEGGELKKVDDFSEFVSSSQKDAKKVFNRLRQFV